MINLPGEDSKYRIGELIYIKGKNPQGRKKLNEIIQEKTGKSRETVNRWINYPISSNKEIGLDDARIVAAILECSIDDLLTPRTDELFVKKQKQAA